MAFVLSIFKCMAENEGLILMVSSIKPRKQKHIPKKIVKTSRTHPRAAALGQSPQDEQEQLCHRTTLNPEAKTETAPQGDQASAHRQGMKPETQNQGQPLRQTAQITTFTNPQSTYERRAVQGLLQMPLWVDRNRRHPETKIAEERLSLH